MKTPRTNRSKLWRVYGIVALLLALLPMVNEAQAREGGLDPAFGNKGRAATPLKIGDGGPMAVSPDGSIVVSSGRLLTRFLADGRLDPGFGNGGQLALPEEVEGFHLSVKDVAIDSQGRLILFGVATDSDQLFLEPAHLLSTPASWVVVLRLVPDGALDPSFGSGKGYVRSDFGIKSDFRTDIPLIKTVSGRLDAHDRPVMIVQAAGLTGNCAYGHTSFIWYPRAVVRLTTQGEADPTFESDGIAAIEGHARSPLVAIDGVGGPVAAVGTEGCTAKIIRFAADGFRLPGFGTGGERDYPRLSFSLIEPSGAMIFFEGFPKARVVVRTTPDGNLDPSFGANGRAVIRMRAGRERRLEPVAVDEQRRTVLVGSFHPKLRKRATRGHRDGDKRWHRRPRRSFLAITRLTASGTTDFSFGKRGWIITPFNRPRQVSAEQNALDPQGRLVVMVSSSSGLQPPGARRIVLVRYLLDES